MENKLVDDLASPMVRRLLEHRPMRAPQEHGAVLQIPPKVEWDGLWRSNLQIQEASASLHFSDWNDLVKLAREEVVSAAVAYSGQYREVNLAGRDVAQVVMAGHQPTLFHPGVWYKNFVLDHLADQFKSVALNLVVDNDISESSSVAVPQIDSGSVSLEYVKIDGGGEIVPFEERRIFDQQLFDSFGERVAKAVSQTTASPIVQQLWQHVSTESNTADERLGLAIARGRHAYESSLGLETLELPISKLSQTKAFACFACEILFRIGDFSAIYNSTVELYRRLNKVRSSSHPVPNLHVDDDWFETPFWIWHADRPQRKSLYARLVGTELELSDRIGFNFICNPKNSVEHFLAAGNDDFRIRPKALMTTMFSRLLVADLFIHGIGGAKYDQLTDAIALQFFNRKLPQYLAVTSTMRFQQAIPVVSRQQINQQRDLLRQLEFHPEAFLDSQTPEIEQCVEAKQKWIGLQLPTDKRKERHDGIVACNEQLQSLIAGKREAIAKQVRELKELLPVSKVANSREFSFCLFGESLVDELRVR